MKILLSEFYTIILGMQKKQMEAYLMLKFTLWD